MILIRLHIQTEPSSSKIQRNFYFLFFFVCSKTCLKPKTCSTIYHGGQFYWWGKPEYPEKTTDLPQVADKLYHIMVGLELTTLVVIGKSLVNIQSLTSSAPNGLLIISQYSYMKSIFQNQIKLKFYFSSLYNIAVRSPFS